MKYISQNCFTRHFSWRAPNVCVCISVQCVHGCACMPFLSQNQSINLLKICLYLLCLLFAIICAVLVWNTFNAYFIFKLLLCFVVAHIRTIWNKFSLLHLSFQSGQSTRNCHKCMLHLSGGVFSLILETARKSVV